jgi:hypothetical protein
MSAAAIGVMAEPAPAAATAVVSRPAGHNGWRWGLLRKPAVPLPEARYQLLATSSATGDRTEEHL